MSPRAKVESRLLRTLLALPEPAQRALAGRRRVVDGQTLATDVQLLLRLQAIARPRRESEVPIAELRAKLRAEAPIVGGRQPVGAVRALEVAGRPARHYLPTEPAGAAEYGGPLLVYIHGGGFIEGDLDTHDAPCRALAEQSGVPVLSVSYRLAPEHKFPAAYDDCWAAYRWVHEHAAELGADPDRLAVGGDSAGGNLAARVAIEAARAGVPLAWQLLIYPVAEGHRDTDSLRLFGEGYYLTEVFMDRCDEAHLNGPSERDDERISLVRADLPDGLAPAYVVTAGFDPLRDEGEAYSRHLADAGVKVELQRFTGQIHGFVNMVGVGRSMPAAVGEIADRLRTALV